MRIIIFHIIDTRFKITLIDKNVIAKCWLSWILKNNKVYPPSIACWLEHGEINHFIFISRAKMFQIIVILYMIRNLLKKTWRKI